MVCRVLQTTVTRRNVEFVFETVIVIILLNDFRTRKSALVVPSDFSTKLYTREVTICRARRRFRQ